MGFLGAADQARGDAVVGLLHDLLDPVLLGVYLHGSAVLGELRPTSDVDLPAVTTRPLTRADRAEIVAGVLRLSGRAQRPVDLTVVNLDDVRPWRFPPVVQLVYGEWIRGDLERGIIEGPHEDPDLALTVDVVLRHGEALVGPSASRLLDQVPAIDRARACVAGVPGLLANLDGDSRNVLLTLCRIWVTLATGEVVPKDVAAAWVLARLPPQHCSVVGRARRMYLDGWDEDRWPDPAAVRRAAAALTEGFRHDA